MQRWGDGFDHYGVRANADVFYTHSNYAIANTNPRTGNWSARLNNGNGQWFTRPVVAARTLIMGAALFTPSTTSGGLQGMYLSTNNDFATAIAIYITSTNAILVAKGPATTLGQTAPGVYTPGTYNYIEAKAFNNNGAGTVEVHLNGVQVLLLTGLAMTNQDFNNAGFCGNLGDNTNVDKIMDIDDFYINDTTGIYNNDFAGVVRCRTRFTSANGGAQDWIPLNAPAYSELNVIPFNGATHHISGNVGDVSNFVVDAVPTNTAFAASQIVFVVAAKSDAGACTIVPHINSGGTVANGPVINPDVTYGMYLGGIFEFDPHTGAAWLLPGIQATLPQVERFV